MQWQTNLFAKTIYLKGEINKQELTIHNIDIYRKFKTYLLKNWYRFQEKPEIFLEQCIESSFINNDFDQNSFEVVAKLLSLEEQNLNIALLFLNEIIKMSTDIPNLTNKAISTGNPFLFRSLFLDFKEAEKFAVGGKLNSSLETKYGNLFEKIMGAFCYCREIYDGGIDVVVDNNAFDIKSGTNVMNKSMVDAFSAKQILIQGKKILPELNTYKIALGYGRRENLNSFMAKIDSEILTAREAWKTITGIEDSPEIVFAIAGLIPKVFEVNNLVSSILNKSQNNKIDSSNNLEFSELFNNHFDQIELNLESREKIEKIENLL